MAVPQDGAGDRHSPAPALVWYVRQSRNNVDMWVKPKERLIGLGKMVGYYNEDNK